MYTQREDGARRHRRVGQLEEAALAFARQAPAQLVADVIESMIADLVDAVVGPFGLPLADDQQLEAPWSCTGCGNRRGFRRRGFRPKPRKVMTACGQVSFRSAQLGCGACGRRFAPAAELLGLRPHQRRTEALSELAASLAVEVAYAKASRLLAELAGYRSTARRLAPVHPPPDRLNGLGDLVAGLLPGPSGGPGATAIPLPGCRWRSLSVAKSPGTRGSRRPTADSSAGSSADRRAGLPSALSAAPLLPAVVWWSGPASIR
jgi:hypothetical protein